MHMNRSSSSFLPSLCSLHALIGIAVILCVYFTLHTSISLHDKSLPSQHVKFDLPPPRLLDYSNENENSSVNQSPPNSFYRQDSQFAHQSPPYSLHSKEETIIHKNPSPNKLEEIVGGLAKEFDITWGDYRGKFHENGTLLTLSLDKYSGSGFQSKNEYLFAKIDIKIKLIAGNSAGTVTTFYMSSNETAHDEIDFEFLGNVSGQPYTVHTNVYSQGKGNREKQFYLWFDPTEDFHSYSILWNPARIVFFVDGVPIREFKNMEAFGVPYPSKQPMRIYSSLWNADDWATQGGRVHTDWSKAPFVASYKDFSIDACVWSFGSSSCGLEPGYENSRLMEELDSKSLEKMRWAQGNYMTYDYCNDKWRFYQEGLPKECTIRVPRRRRLY